MRLLVATHSYLAAVEVSAELEVEHLKVISRGYFYGVDQLSDGRLIAAERRNPYTKRSPTVFHIYDEDLAEVSSWMDEEVVDAHQLTFVEGADDFRSGIYVCDTGHNRLARVDLEAQATESAARFAESSHDVVHLNSVSEDAEGSLWLVLHNLGYGESQVVRGTDGKVWTLAHRSIHNFEAGPYRPKTFFYNASDDGRVCWHHLDIGLCREVVVGGHSKGLAISDDWVFAGVSEHAVKRERRFIADGKIAVIDLQDFELREMLNLRHEDEPLGNLNELRLLDD